MTRRSPNLIDTLARVIPGYRGYADRDARRTADKLLRESVARRLVAMSRDVDALVLRAVDEGRLAGLDDLDRLKRELSACADAFRYAPAGGSGLMDDHVVAAADLDRAHAHDLEIEQQARELGADLAAASARGAAEVLALRPRVGHLRELIAQREDVLREVFD